MTLATTSSAAAPMTARRRAGPAWRAGVSDRRRRRPRWPPRRGEQRRQLARASCQTGHGGVRDQRRRCTSTSGRPEQRRDRPARPRQRARTGRCSAFAAAIPVAGPYAARIHEPTLIGEVTLNIRSMFRSARARPRSEISSAGLTADAGERHRPRAPREHVVAGAAAARYASRPRRPPSRRRRSTHGISGVQTGALMTGRP